jgi:hypothetical protein
MIIPATLRDSNCISLAELTRWPATRLAQPKRRRRGLVGQLAAALGAALGLRRVRARPAGPG